MFFWYSECCCLLDGFCGICLSNLLGLMLCYYRYVILWFGFNKVKMD